MRQCCLSQQKLSAVAAVKYPYTDTRIEEKVPSNSSLSNLNGFRSTMPALLVAEVRSPHLQQESRGLSSKFQKFTGNNKPMRQLAASDLMMDGFSNAVAVYLPCRSRRLCFFFKQTRCFHTAFLSVSGACVVAQSHWSEVEPCLSSSGNERSSMIEKKNLPVWKLSYITYIKRYPVVAYWDRQLSPLTSANVSTTVK